MPNDMLQNSLAADSPSTDCISDVLLLKYIEGDATAQEAAAVQQHLNECALCFQVVATMRRNEGVTFTAMEELEVAKLLRLSPQAQVTKILEYAKELNPHAAPEEDAEDETTESRTFAVEAAHRQRRSPFLGWLQTPFVWRPAFAALLVLFAFGGRLGWQYFRTDYKIAQAAELLQKEHTVFYKYARLSGGYNLSVLDKLMGPEEEENYSARAEKLTTQAIKNGATSMAAKQQLAKIFLIEGKYERADSLLQELAPFANKSASLLNDLGVYHFQKQDWNSAAKYFTAAIAADPKFLEARYNLALANAETGAIEEAIRIMNEYLALETDDEWKAAGESLVKNVWRMKE